MADIVVNDVNTTTVVQASDGSVVVSTNEATAVVSVAEASTIVTTDTATDVVTVDSGVVIAEVEVTTVIETGSGGGTGGGPTSYVRPSPMLITVGGATPGTTFVSTIEAALDTILYPYQNPAFSSFSFPQTTPLEVGDTIAAGSKSFSWATTNPTNIAANSMQIVDVTASVTLGSTLSLTSPQSFSVGPITKASAVSHVWTAYATNTQSAVFNRSFTVNWYWRTYYGESVLTALTSADILALRVTGLESSFSGNKVFVGGGYKFLCYPTTFGLKTTFKDTATNLDVAMIPSVLVAVTNSFGAVQNYYVHRTLNVLGGAITIAVS